MLKVTSSDVVVNKNGQAILMVTVLLSAVLVGLMTTLMGMGHQTKAQNVVVSKSQAILSHSSTSRLMSDGSNCAFALRNQMVFNQANSVTLAVPGDVMTNTSSSMAGAGQSQAGTSLQISSVIITPTSWPGTPIAFTGSPNAISVPATLQITYGLNMDRNYGTPIFQGKTINLNLVLNSIGDPHVIGCVDPLVQTCLQKARAVNPVAISPMARQNCDQIVALQIDNGDQNAPSTMRCGLSTTHNVYCWGGAVSGQVDSTLPQSEPQLISVFNENVTQVASSGGGFSCAVASGAAYCWGSNQFNQVVPGPNFIAAPTLVPNLPGTVLKITTSAATTCALVSNSGVNQVYCWGKNDEGEVGAGYLSSYVATPTDVGLTQVTDIVGRNTNFCAIKTDDSLWCWGTNGSGILESVGSYNGGAPLSPVPVQITGLAGPISAVTVGWNHACVLLTNGQVQCWGQNESGEFGDGATSFAGSTAPPGAIATGMTNAVQVSAGANYTCAVDAAGAAWCWGAGIGTTPVLQAGLTTGVAEIQTGSERTCSRMTCGQVRCSGNNQFGNLGDGTTNNSSVPVIAKTFAGTGCPP